MKDKYYLGLTINSKRLWFINHLFTRRPTPTGFTEDHFCGCCLATLKQVTKAKKIAVDDDKRKIISIITSGI